MPRDASTYDGLALEAKRDATIYQQALRGDAQAVVAFGAVVNSFLAADSQGKGNIRTMLNDMQGINPAAAAAYQKAWDYDRASFTTDGSVLFHAGTGR